MFGLEFLLDKFNNDKILFSPAAVTILGDLFNALGYQTMKNLLLIAAEVSLQQEKQQQTEETQNETLPVHDFNLNHIDFAREQRKMREKMQKEAVKQERDRKKQIEKEKRKFLKTAKKRNKIDRATEKLGFGLSHSSEEKHILLFTPIGRDFFCLFTVSDHSRRYCPTDREDRL